MYVFIWLIWIFVVFQEGHQVRHQLMHHLGHVSIWTTKQELGQSITGGGWRTATGKVVRGQCKITFLSLLMRRLQWITAWASLIRQKASEPSFQLPSLPCCFILSSSFICFLAVRGVTPFFLPFPSHPQFPSHLFLYVPPNTLLSSPLIRITTAVCCFAELTATHCELSRFFSKVLFSPFDSTS